MNLNRKEIKLNARKALKGNYGILILGYFLLMMIVYAIYIPMYLVTLVPVFLSTVIENRIMMIVSIVILATLVILVISIIATLLSVGYYRMIFEVVQQGNTKIERLFYGFKNRPLTFFSWTMLSVVIGFLMVVPTIGVLLFGIYLENTMIIIIGWILYVITFVVLFLISPIFNISLFILVEEPQIGAINSYKIGMKIMKGNIFRFWGLYLSFFGMYVLTMLTMGIGIYWFVPYTSAATILLIQDIKKSAVEMKTE